MLGFKKKIQIGNQSTGIDQKKQLNTFTLQPIREYPLLAFFVIVKGYLFWNKVYGSYIRLTNILYSNYFNNVNDTLHFI